MRNPISLGHDEYVSGRRERDPEFAASYDEASATMGLALGLANLRQHRNLSQRALEEKSGIKQPMINRIERGSQVPRAVTLLRLLRVLNGVITMLPNGAIYVRPVEAPDSAAQPDSSPGTGSSENGSSGVLDRQRA
jgi:DNA-binding XRE family transcriptional regulator